MNIIKPSFSIIEPTGYTIDDIYKSIELAGRVSHKSEHNIKEGSAKDFVGRMLNMKHLATCEFGTVYLRYNDYMSTIYTDRCIVNKYIDNEYSKVFIKSHKKYPISDVYITVNYRTLVENDWLDDLKYLCEPTEYHHKRYTVKFICDRAIANEIVRHRKFSFLQESTRYCKYSADKFNNELTFIEPCWLTPDMKSNLNYLKWEAVLQEIEKSYLILTKNGWKAEEARSILPLSLKTELYMCGYAEDWEKFFELRCASNAHPQCRELAIPLREEFYKRRYIEIKDL